MGRGAYALVALALFGSPAAAEEESSEVESLDLPPVPVDELSQGAPQPSWDTGLLLGACGVGNEQAWEITKFCLGGLADMMFFRQREDEFGLGAYGQISTAGFRDVRFSLGPSTIFSLVDWFSVGLRGGGLLAVGSGGATPGLEGMVELGHRSVSLSSHYALSHSLLGGMQYTLATRSRPASTTIWVGLRIDAVWLTAPVALFR